MWLELRVGGCRNAWLSWRIFGSELSPARTFCFSSWSFGTPATCTGVLSCLHALNSRPVDESAASLLSPSFGRPPNHTVSEDSFPSARKTREGGPKLDLRPQRRTMTRWALPLVLLATTALAQSSISSSASSPFSSSSVSLSTASLITSGTATASKTSTLIPAFPTANSTTTSSSDLYLWAPDQLVECGEATFA